MRKEGRQKILDFYFSYAILRVPEIENDFQDHSGFWEEEAPMRSIKSGSALLLLLLILFTTVATRAQGQSSQLTLKGRVLDPLRAPIAGARITAIPDGRSSGPSILSDEAGEFVLNLERGIYALKTTAEGFQESVQTIRMVSGSEFISVGLQ